MELRAQRRAPRRYTGDPEREETPPPERPPANMPEYIHIYDPNLPRPGFPTMEPGQVRPPPPKPFDLKEFMGDDFEERPDVKPEEGARGAVELYEEHLEAVGKEHSDVGGWVECPFTHPDGEVEMRYLPKVGHADVLFSYRLCSRS